MYRRSTHCAVGRGLRHVEKNVRDVMNSAPQRRHHGNRSQRTGGDEAWPAPRYPYNGVAVAACITLGVRQTRGAQRLHGCRILPKHEYPQGPQSIYALRSAQVLEFRLQRTLCASPLPNQIKRQDSLLACEQAMWRDIDWPVIHLCDADILTSPSLTRSDGRFPVTAALDIS